MQNSVDKNIDLGVVSGFGEEWQRFDQSLLSDEERQQIFNDYFSLFPFEILPFSSVGADIGCGSGRWAQIVAPRVSVLNVVDASEKALKVAKGTLATFENIQYHHASVGALPFPTNSLDFAYSLGVLHHVPDTLSALQEIARVLKPGAPFLVYLYYAFDNRPFWYRGVWKLSDILRKMVARFPNVLRHLTSELLAALIYWPLARIALLMDRYYCLPPAWPLSYYRDKSFYTMRTDALDRFGTSLEQRFTRAQITGMLEDSGFNNIEFTDHVPYWCAVCLKK